MAERGTKVARWARICTVCGMLHVPGNCAAFDHLSDGYMALRNELDALKRKLGRRA